MGKNIAVVPARGGSKSIPLKNIIPIFGKPLIYWVLEALNASGKIDIIYVATDSDIIQKEVEKMDFMKVEIYNRLPENATDTSSTESVLLECIDQLELKSDDNLILVQATSPLIQTKHIDEAFEMFDTKKFDSILSCVISKRFFWSEDGTSKNYEYKNRPRRQDFKGELMENGALYINSVENILCNRNRLCGNIGIYIMPSYTEYEIDEPEDIIIVENLLSRYKTTIEQHSIKLLVCDIDGVLTDGGMYYSEHGDELKKFNTKDGMAMQILREKGILTGFITSEITPIVERRAKKLKVDFLYQGRSKGGKLSALEEILLKENIKIKEVAYIGDDINCLDILSVVGIKACPNDAQEIIAKIPGIIKLSKNGGEGVLREFVDKFII